MASEFEVIEERLKNLSGQLQTEFGILDRIVYKNKNQHRRCNYFQYLLKVRRYLRLLQSAKLEEILNSCFLVIHGKRPKQKVQLLESLKRRNNGGKHNFLERLLGVARLLSEMVEPMLKAAVDISKLLAQSFFKGFSLTILSLLARLRVLIQQMLLDVVCVYNSVSSLSRKQQAIKITDERCKVFREYYPVKEQFNSLECIWQVDKYVLVEKMNNESEPKSQGEAGKEDVLQGSSSVQYQTIEVVLGDNKTGEVNPESAVQGSDATAKDINSSADPVSQSKLEKYDRDDSTSAESAAKSSLTAEGGLLTPSSSSVHSNPLKRKAGKDKVAFLSVKSPSISSVKKLDSGAKLTEKVDEQEEDPFPFFSLLSCGTKKSSIF